MHLRLFSDFSHKHSVTNSLDFVHNLDTRPGCVAFGALGDAEASTGRRDTSPPVPVKPPLAGRMVPEHLPELQAPAGVGQQSSADQLSGSGQTRRSSGK